MKRLQEQENFEIELLEFMKNQGMLRQLIFGGGTMLRLCHELNRFSLDLDFWCFGVKDFEIFFTDLKKILAKKFELRDAANKLNTILFEIRNQPGQGLLKIEIRKNMQATDYEEQIAFSRYSNKQVLLKVFTLKQMAKNKISALIGRKEIRDAFDLEFILKKGIIPDIQPQGAKKIREIISGFTARDYKVALGSLLEQSQRAYYTGNNFIYLVDKLNEITEGRT